MFSLWSWPSFRGFVPSSLVCAEKGPGGQWAAEWRVQQRPTSLAPSTECVLSGEQPYILSRFVELESTAGDGGDKWWGQLVARWLTDNCSMPVLIAWHFFLFSFLFCFIPSLLPPIYLSVPPHWWSVDNEGKERVAKTGRRRAVYRPLLKNPVIIFLTM
jgi:hypothetical protein